MKKIPHLIPVAPLIPFIQERIRQETAELFSERCGVSPKWFANIIAGRSEYTTFQRIDALLAKEGSRTVIDFYPEYADEDFLKEAHQVVRTDEQPKRIRKRTKDHVPVPRVLRVDCSRDDCTKPHHGKGLCRYHYRTLYQPAAAKKK
jgi:hypothetical protein